MFSTSSSNSWLRLRFHNDDQQNIVKPDELEIGEQETPPSINDDPLLDRIEGSILGMAIGDALGAHVEFRPHAYLKANPVKDLQRGGTWGLEKGQFTDDTSMALCLANSLIVCQGFQPYDQMVRYKWWYRHGYMSSTGHCFDIGAATRQSIQEFESRQRKFAQDYSMSLNEMDSFANDNPSEQVDVYCSKDGVAGNGALMRLAPVPLFFYRDPIKAVEYSGISGQITHGDIKAYDACRYYGALIVAALNGEKKDNLLSKQFYENHKLWFGGKVLHQDILNIAQGSYQRKGGYEDGIRGKGYIVSALEAALWAFWSDGDSFNEGALNAVNLGDDTDTTAAIYGQLAGVYYGYKNLPSRWCDLLYAKSFLLCISRWIAFEGDQWFNTQKEFPASVSLMNSDVTSENKTSDGTKRSIFQLDLSNEKLLKSLMSMGYNSIPIISRKVVNTSAQIGSFYNLYEDRLIESENINLGFSVDERSSMIKCQIWKGDQIECENLLRLTHFDVELQLSIISGIIPPTGIASLIEYPFLIDECTRILYYSHTVRYEYLSEELHQIEEHIKRSTNKENSTHLITGINRGIDLLVIIRFTSNSSKIVDQTLDKLRDSLVDNQKKLSKEISLHGILSTHSYSNIAQLTGEKTLIDLFNEISLIEKNRCGYLPINSILYSGEKFLPEVNKSSDTFLPLRKTIREKMEEHFSSFLRMKKIWRTNFNEDKLNILQKDFEEQFKEFKEQLKKLNEIEKKEKKRLAELILNLRHRKYSDNTEQIQIFPEKFQTTLKLSIDDLTYSLTSLKEKISFIDDLKKRHFDYINAKRFHFQINDNEKTIERRLKENHPNSILLCSDDSLNNNTIFFNELISQLIHQRKQFNEHQSLIYLDFTYSLYKFNQIKVFPQKYQIMNRNERRSLLQTRTISSTHSLLSSENDQTISILLLGKSGVGKTTFIQNLRSSFGTNRQENVRSNLHLISSINSSIGDEITLDFEERFVQIGQPDPNENVDHEDQSTTQQCQFYRFNSLNGKKVCLIDTPGFGKENNDEMIIHHIASRLIKLNHLNAICLFIDSNEKQFDSYQISLSKLFNYFGNNICQNILFCFTKSLSKTIDDYQRNHSIELLIQSLGKTNLLFNEERIFHFDNTSFINSFIRQRFNSSDQISLRTFKSVKEEWNRLLDYIQTNPQSFNIEKQLTNSQLTSLQINELIRPLFETLRNYFRNVILSKFEGEKCFIQFHPISMRRPSAICFSCSRYYIRYGHFWIRSDPLHRFVNLCNDCFCRSHEHFRSDYRLEYQYKVNHTVDQSVEVPYNPDELLQIILRFSHFLLLENEMKNKDFFLFYLNQMINEERFICKKLPASEGNSSLLQHLLHFQHDYQKRLNQMMEKQGEEGLNIHELIQIVCAIPAVKIQLDAATKTHETEA